MYEIREYITQMDYLFCEKCERRVDDSRGQLYDWGCDSEPVKKTEYRMIVIEADSIDTLEEAVRKVEEGEAAGIKNVTDESWDPTVKIAIHMSADGHNRAQAIEYLNEGLHMIKGGGDFCSMHDPDVDPSIPSLHYSHYH